MGTAETDKEVSEEELKDAQVEAKAHREEMDDKAVEDLFGEADEEGFEESSPERVTDDELFNEKDFENIQEYIDDDGNQRFWEVEESYDVENEEAAPKKTLRDPGEPTKQEWEEHRVDHIPYRSWCPYCCLLYTSPSPRDRG